MDDIALEHATSVFYGLVRAWAVLLSAFNVQLLCALLEVPCGHPPIFHIVWPTFKALQRTPQVPNKFLARELSIQWGSCLPIRMSC